MPDQDDEQREAMARAIFIQLGRDAYGWEGPAAPRSPIGIARAEAYRFVDAALALGWRAPGPPTEAEVERVKRAFFRSEETAMQLHVPPADHINVHPFCLHLWRPHDAEIPMPPKWMVG